jgi:hypothetical protein
MSVSVEEKGDSVFTILFLLAVLVVLDKRKGRVALHSFCAASGLFSFTDELGKVVEKQLAVKK